MLGNQLTSIIRTVVPFVVGYVVSFLTTNGYDVPLDVQNWLSGLLTTAFGSVYYIAARWLEVRWPKLGWLLGVAAQPLYTKVAK